MASVRVSKRRYGVKDHGLRHGRENKASVYSQITVSEDLSILVINEREYKSLYDWCQLVRSSGKTLHAVWSGVRERERERAGLKLDKPGSNAYKQTNQQTNRQNNKRKQSTSAIEKTERHIPMQ